MKKNQGSHPVKSLAIITGASAGLGAALALEMSQPGRLLLLCARRMDQLKKTAKACEERGSETVLLELDLTDSGAHTSFQKSFKRLEGNRFEETFLINNAGRITPIERLENLKPAEIQDVIGLNLNAAVWMTGLYLNFCRRSQIPRSFIVNITSGVSLKPVVGWGLYCMSKAGLNMLTYCTVEETKNWPYPVQCVAVNPGPLDTPMQEEIRNSEIEGCPQKEALSDLYKSRRMPSVEEGARNILAVLKRAPFPQGQVIDLRDQGMRELLKLS